MPYCRIDHIYASDDVIRVIKSSNKVGQSFCSVRGEMVNIAKLVVVKEVSEKTVIQNTGSNKCDILGNIGAKASRQIVQCYYSNAFGLNQCPNDVRPKKPSSACDECCWQKMRAIHSAITFIQPWANCS